MSVLPPRYQPEWQRGERDDGDDVRKHCRPCLKLRHGKIYPITVLQMKEDNRNGEAAVAIMCTNGILAVECTPNAERRTAGNKNAEGNPPTCANVLTMQPPEQRNERPTTQCEKNDDEQNAHTRSV